MSTNILHIPPRILDNRSRVADREIALSVLATYLPSSSGRRRCTALTVVRYSSYWCASWTVGPKWSSRTYDRFSLQFRNDPGRLHRDPLSTGSLPMMCATQHIRHTQLGTILAKHRSASELEVGRKLGKVKRCWIFFIFNRNPLKTTRCACASSQLL